MNVYEKIQECRCRLQLQEIKKTGKNNFAGFQYYTLDDFIPHINALFKEFKLFSAFNIVEGIATLRIIDAEKPDDFVVFTSPTADANLKGCTPIQSLGGVHTYMKRYLYLNALEICEPDLLDSVQGKDDQEKKPAPAPAPAVKPVQPAPATNKLICEDCGCEIKGANGLDANSVAQFTKKKYGKQVCAECGAKLKANLKKEGN